MASVINDGKTKRVQFTGADDKRQTIYLGGVSVRQANAVKEKVEKLVSASLTSHPPDEEVSRWIKGLEPKMSEKLVRVGLLKSTESVQLGAWLERYIANLNLKPKSIKKYQASKDKLIGHFKATTDIRKITLDDAAKWRESLAASNLSESSVRGFCRDAKTMLREAVERELIDKSPFRKLASASVASEKPHYVPLAVALKFLDGCESLEWRVLFSLARLEGLRVPSESHLLTWQCVNWQSGELTVRSPKTERFKGKALRIVPLCPVVVGILREAFEKSSEPSGKIVTLAKNNRDREFKRQLKAVGIPTWPRLFQNLRVSCEIQWLMEGHPEFAVTQWIGHSVAVSRKHYANIVPQDDYALFRGIASPISKTAQNPTQQTDAETGIGSHPFDSKNRINRLSGDDATLCDLTRMSALGLEPRTYGLKVRCSTN
jgi:site-specific recombinase XerD